MDFVEKCRNPCLSDPFGPVESGIGDLLQYTTTLYSANGFHKKELDKNNYLIIIFLLLNYYGYNLYGQSNERWFMTSRERVLSTFKFQNIDRPACDLMEGRLWDEIEEYFRISRKCMSEDDIIAFLDLLSGSAHSVHRYLRRRGTDSVAPLSHSHSCYGIFRSWQAAIWGYHDRRSRDRSGNAASGYVSERGIENMSYVNNRDFSERNTVLNLQRNYFDACNLRAGGEYLAVIAL